MRSWATHGPSKLGRVWHSDDDDDDTETDTYYGQIEEIWELDYVGLKDKYGYDLRVFGYKNELFVFANNVEQVFYVPDLAKKNWSVVMPEKKDC
jgi:hypothetical protein